MQPRTGRWLLSKKASVLFLWSSIVVLTTGALLLTLTELISLDVTRELSSKPAIYLPLAALLTANFLCAVLLVVGMLWYWMRLDDSRRVAKLLWLGSFVVLGWYSMAIYYFFVYRRQKWSATGAKL